MLCVRAGRKNSLAKLHYSTLCLRVSCIRARQNSFNCWVSPGDKKWYWAAWNWSGSRLLPIESNGKTSSFLAPLRGEFIESVWAELSAGKAPSKQSKRHQARAWEWHQTVCGWKLPEISVSGSKDCIGSLLKCINLFLKVIE